MPASFFPLLWAHAFQGKSSMCPASQATRKRAARRRFLFLSGIVPHGLLPLPRRGEDSVLSQRGGRSVNSGTSLSTLQRGQKCHFGKRTNGSGAIVPGAPPLWNFGGGIRKCPTPS